MNYLSTIRENNYTREEYLALSNNDDDDLVINIAKYLTHIDMPMISVESDLCVILKNDNLGEYVLVTFHDFKIDDGISIGVFTRFVPLNNKFERLFGYSYKTMTGKMASYLAIIQYEDIIPFFDDLKHSNSTIINCTKKNYLTGESTSTDCQFSSFFAYSYLK